MTKLEKLRGDTAVGMSEAHLRGMVSRMDALNMCLATWDECYKIMEKHCEELIEAFKSCEAAMVYAFEDRADQYYMNVLKKYKEAIKKHEEFLK